jgi:hypothetical protein
MTRIGNRARQVAGATATALLLTGCGTGHEATPLSMEAEVSKAGAAGASGIGRTTGQRPFTVYLLALPDSGPHAHRGAATFIAPEQVEGDDTGQPGLDAVRALLAADPAQENRANGFDSWPLLDGPDSLAEVRSVTEHDGVIRVDLSRSIHDPYPNVDCRCPDGHVVTQQLVWTVQDALDSEAPVLVTVDGTPARGIWLHELEGPVEADPTVLECRPASC